jgi:hypothetical protein
MRDKLSTWLEDLWLFDLTWSTLTDWAIDWPVWPRVNWVKPTLVADTKGSTATLVHQSLKQRQWKSHQPVHWGLKYEHSAGSLEIETETVGVPPASPLGIEIFTARQLVGDWNRDSGSPTSQPVVHLDIMILASQYEASNMFTGQLVWDEINICSISAGQPIGTELSNATGQLVLDQSPASAGWPIRDGQLSSQVAGLQWVKSLKGLESCVISINWLHLCVWMTYYLTPTLMIMWCNAMQWNMP